MENCRIFRTLRQGLIGAEAGQGRRKHREESAHQEPAWTPCGGKTCAHASGVTVATRPSSEANVALLMGLRPRVEARRVVAHRLLEGSQIECPHRHSGCFPGGWSAPRSGARSAESADSEIPPPPGRVAARESPRDRSRGLLFGQRCITAQAMLGLRSSPSLHDRGTCPECHSRPSSTHPRPRDPAGPRVSRTLR